MSGRWFGKCESGQPAGLTMDIPSRQIVSSHHARNSDLLDSGCSLAVSENCNMCSCTNTYPESGGYLHPRREQLSLLTAQDTATLSPKDLDRL